MMSSDVEAELSVTELKDELIIAQSACQRIQADAADKPVIPKAAVQRVVPAQTA